MRVLYVTDWDPSSGSATASIIRAGGLVQALELGGIEVTRVHRTPSGGFLVSSENPDNTDTWRDAGEQGRGESLWNRARRKYYYDRPLNALVTGLDPDYVITGVGIGVTRAVAEAATTHGIPTVIEISDWYDLWHVPRSSTPQWLLNEVAVRNARRRAPKVIAISDYLGEYFKAGGCQAIVVPPLFAPGRWGFPGASEDDHIRICFAGVAATKDAIAIRNVVRAIAQLDPGCRLFAVDLVGTTEREIHTLLRTSESIPPNVHLHPRMPHRQAVALVASSDFTVIQRPEGARYAKAGFPSKVAESLIHGTPVIGNITSDLSRYLVHGSNAIVLRDESLEAMVEGLEEAVASPLRWDRRRVAAEAEAAFSPASYAERIRNFLDA